jgi:hypothetical protein
VRGSVLSDGFVCGTWRITRPRGSPDATLVIHRVGPMGKRATGALSAEGRRFARFIDPAAETYDVRLIDVS